MIHLFNSENYAYNPNALPHFAVAFLVLLLGLFVFAKKSRSFTNLAFLLGTIAIFIWLTGHAMLNLTANPAVAMSWSRYKWLGVTLIAPFFYLFTVSFLGTLQRQRIPLIIAYAISFVFSFLALRTSLLLVGIRKYSWGYYPQMGAVGYVFVVFFILLAILSFWNYHTSYKVCKSESRRNQIRFFFLASCSASIGLVDFLPCFGFDTYPVAFVFIFLFAAIAGYSMVRYHALEVYTALHRTVMWLLASSLPLMLFIIMLPMLRPWLRMLDNIQLSFLLIGFFLAFFAYMEEVQPKIDRLFQPRKYNAIRIIKDFSRELTDLKSLKELDEKVSSTICKVFEASHASIIAFKAYNTRRIDHEEKLDLAEPEQAFVEWLQQYQNTIERKQLEKLPLEENVRSGGAEFFRQTSSRLCVPLIRNNLLMGTLCVGERINRNRYSPRDLELLSMLVAPTAIALSNSLLYDQVTELNEELRSANLNLDSNVRERTLKLESVNRRLRCVHDISRSISRSLEKNTLVDALLEEVMLGFNFTGIRLVQFQNPENGNGTRGLQLPQGHGLEHDDELCLRRAAETKNHLFRNGKIFFPLIADNEVTGVLVASLRSSSFVLDREDIDALVSITNQAAILLQNSELYMKLKHVTEELELKVTDRTKELQLSLERLKEVNTKLKAAQQQLIQSSKLAATGEMAAKIAHELGNPIAIISGAAQHCLENFTLDASVQECVEVVRRNSHIAARIVRELLDYSRPPKQELSDVNIAEVLDKVCFLSKIRCFKRNISLKQSFARTDLHIYAIPNHLEQVFLNLALNSTEALPDGGEIEIKLNLTADGNAIEIVCEDSGKGISPENLERIFDPFFTTKAGNSGLGLAICRELISLYDGVIKAENREGGGARFTVTFPYDPARRQNMLVLEGAK